MQLFVLLMPPFFEQKGDVFDFIGLIEERPLSETSEEDDEEQIEVNKDDIVYVEGYSAMTNRNGLCAASGIFWKKSDRRNYADVLYDYDSERRATLQGVLDVLEHYVDYPYPIEIRTSCGYVDRVLNEWCYSFRRNGWRTKAGRRAANVSLLKAIMRIMEIRPAPTYIVYVPHLDSGTAIEYVKQAVGMAARAICLEFD